MPEVKWHAIQELDGIGPSVAKDAAHLGFHYAENLLRRNSVAIAQDLEHINGFTLNNMMLSFIPQARLLRLGELHVSQAVALNSAGFDYGRLCFSDTSRIENALENVDPGISSEGIADLRFEAAKRLMSSTVTVRVVDESGAPVVGADVFVVDPPGTGDRIAWRFSTNEFGEALVEFLAPTFHRFLGIREDRWGEVSTILQHKEYCTLILALTNHAANGITFDEAIDGPATHLSSTISVERDFAEWPDGTLFQVLSVSDDNIRLAGLHRQRVGAHWKTTVTTAPLSLAIPSTTKPGEVLRLEQGHLDLVAPDAEAFRQELWRDAALANVASRLGGQGHA